MSKTKTPEEEITGMKKALEKLIPPGRLTEGAFGGEETGYTAMSEEALKKIAQAPGYSYDMNSDALYRQYRDMYETGGRKAAENVFGLASAATGGYGSSYAATAANDAYAAYMDRLSEKSAELEEKAYEREKDRRNDLYKQLDAVSALEDRKYRESRDRYSDQRDRYSDQRDRENDEYRELQNEREIERENEQKAVDFAFDAAGLGDYSFLEALGVDTDALKEEQKRKTAAFYAEFGDLSGLTGLGVDVSRLRTEQLYDIANIFARYGDLTLLNKLQKDLFGAKNIYDPERGLVSLPAKRYIG